MKKRILFAAACAAVFAMSTAAFADITLTPGDSVPADADLVSGTSVLKVRGENGYYLEDLEGNVLTDDIYSNSFWMESGYITAYQYDTGDDTNCEGLLDQSGNVILPMEYGDIDVLSSKWTIGFKLEETDLDNYDYQGMFTDKNYLISQADIYYIDEDGAVLLASLPRDQYSGADAHGDYISVENRNAKQVDTYDSSWNVVAEDVGYTWQTGDINTNWYTIFSDNGQQGLQDADGNVIMEPSFRYINDFVGDYATVSTGDKEGVIDKEGNVAVPAEYDNIKYNYKAPVQDRAEGGTSVFNAAGYFGVELDGKGGFVAEGGEVTCEPKLAVDLLDFNGASATYTDLEGNLHILSADGVDSVMPENVSDLRCPDYSNGFLYIIEDDDYNYGLVDWHGNELIPMEQSRISLTGDGKTLVVAEDYENAVTYTVNY